MDASRILISCSLVTISTIVAIWFYRKNKKEKLPSAWTPVGRVSEIYMYPLKSGFRNELQEAECTTFGLRQITDRPVFKLRDRFLIVYNEEDHEFRTGRTHPKLVLIEISNHDADHVVLNAPGMPTIYVQIPKLSDSNSIKCKLHGVERTELLDCGNEAAAWLSKYVTDKDTGLRLGYHDEEMNTRKVNSELSKFYPNMKNSDMGIFSDLTSFMLMTKKSVEDLNTRLERDATGCQFRPNIMVADVDAAYDEDKWDWIKIGTGTVFQNTKPCTRCIFTTLDANTGVFDPQREPLRTLKEYRQLSDEAERKANKNSPVMGINLGLRKAGIIKVNDIVYIGKS